ncbi:hypothetical protein CPT_Slocum_043 [Serratia phage Slocum]|nr:hypothetical protein CPT_Slocum_043 [Serratia phage Slocum]URC22489.1 hypothetical protein KAMAJI_00610 [Serratia phage vB_SmaM-Kamaji]
MYNKIRFVGRAISYFTLDFYLMMVAMVGLFMLLAQPFTVDFGALMHFVQEYTSQFVMTNKDAGELYETH